MENKKTINNITGILDMLHDSASGFRHLAGHLENNELKAVMNTIAFQRNLFLEELEDDLRDMGLQLHAGISAGGYYSETWNDLPDIVESEEDEQRIHEALVGEQELLNRYDKTLRENGLPDYINERMDEHRNMISGSIHQLDEFCRIMV